MYTLFVYPKINNNSKITKQFNQYPIPVIEYVNTIRLPLFYMILPLSKSYYLYSSAFSAAVADAFEYSPPIPEPKIPIIKVNIINYYSTVTPSANTIPKLPINIKEALIIELVLRPIA